MATFGQRVIQAREHARFNQSELARRIGVKPQTIQHLESPKKAARGSKHTPAIARECGVSVDWLAEERGQMLPVAHREQSFHNRDEFLTIQRYESAITDGQRDRGENVMVDSVRVNRVFLRSRIPGYGEDSSLRLLASDGGGVYHDGDIMLVDVGVRDVAGDGVFAFTANDRLYVRRVIQRVADGQYIVTDENERTPPEEFPSSHRFDVIGRVVGVWQWRAP